MNDKHADKVIDEPTALDVFIERFGLITEEDGTPRTAGRIFALLMAAGAPVTFSGIANALQVSRGGTSTNLRLLEEMGMAERVTVAGDRQDYFQLPTDVWYNAMSRKIARELKSRAAIQTLLDSDSGLAEPARDRLQRVVVLLQRSIDHARETLELIGAGTL